MFGSSTERTQANASRLCGPAYEKYATRAAHAGKAAGTERTIHFRARDSGRAKTATLEISIGARRTRRNTPSSMTYGRTSGPSQPGIKKIPAACTSMIAVSPPTYGTSHLRIGWYPSRRRPMYDVRPTRTGGMMKNHFIAMSLINGDPFGVCHRCATSSLIEYRDAVKIHASRKAIPNADRTGAFAGRASRPRSMNGRINRKMTGIPLRMSPQNAALKFVVRGVPSPMMNYGKTSATFSRPHENRRYQSGTISSEICGLRAGPRNGETTAHTKKRLATN